MLCLQRVEVEGVRGGAQEGGRGPSPARRRREGWPAPRGPRSHAASAGLRPREPRVARREDEGPPAGRRDVYLRSGRSSHSLPPAPSASAADTVTVKGRGV